MDHKLILNKAEEGNFERVYLLYGEESLYIDLICDTIIQNALEDHERDFNQTILYGRDAEAGSLLAELRAYPLMSSRRVVVLKEAQDMKSFPDLESYFENPTDTTIFVICHKHGNIDSRKTVYKKAAQSGITFKSDKIPDYKLAEWILRQVKSDGYGISEKAAILLADSIGNDLSRITNELKKLYLLLEKGTTINDIHIEENIGISKDYNFYELSNAIANRNIVKAFEIVDYFVHNPKAGPLIPIISNLFALHKKIMTVHFLENKSKESVASALKIAPFVANQYIQAARIYPPKKVAANIHLLHEFDLKSKGVNNSSMQDGDLMKELVFQLMN